MGANRRMMTSLSTTGLDLKYQLRESGLVNPSTRISASTLARRLGPSPEDGGQPAYRQLAERIRAAVLDGRLTVATGLPSERELAAGLSVSRTTVGAAYGLLREQGWLDSRRGSGSRLRLPDGDLRAGAGSPSTLGPAGTMGAGGIFGWSQDNGRTGGDGVGGPSPVIDLTTACLPAPAEPLADAVAEAARQL